VLNAIAARRIVQVGRDASFHRMAPFRDRPGRGPFGHGGAI